MTDRKLVNDSGNWKRLGRRWTAVLVAMLGTNFCMLVLAVAGYGGGTPTVAQLPNTVPLGEAAVVDHGEATAATASEPKPEAPTTEQQDERVTAEIAAAIVPAPAKEGLGAHPDVRVHTIDETAQRSADDSSKTVGELVAADEAENIGITKDEFMIANPPTTGGTVHFLVEGEVYSLSPGTYRRFIGNPPKRVIFHQGNEEADTEQELATGVFAFAVGTAGWELAPVDSKDRQKLLSRCRLAAE